MTATGRDDVGFYSIEEWTQRLGSGVPHQIVSAIIGMSLYCEDRQLARRVVYDHLRHEDREVVRAAILGVAHIARIDGFVDRGIIPLFRDYLNQNDLRGRVLDAIDDISMFTPVTRDHFGGADRD